MITDLETLLNLDLLLLLICAINRNEPFNYTKGGLTINSNSTDNTLELSIIYDQSIDIALLTKECCSQERKNFVDFVLKIDEDDWIILCEYIGQSKLERISKLLNDDSNIENVREAILAFKKLYKEYILEKIKLYNECLETLFK